MATSRSVTKTYFGGEAIRFEASVLGWSRVGQLGDIHGTTSTIEIGTLTIGLFDPATKQLVWRGSASKTLDIKKDPDKNYRNLEKAMAKLFKNYPPGTGKR